MTASIAPTVLWAQRKDRVFVSIQLDDVSDENISVDTEKLTFSAKCRDKSYVIDLEFNGNIVPEESKQRKGGREYYFDLKKKDVGPYWPRLLKDKLKRQNIKIDFGRWKDEDESDDEQGAGGGGGAGGMYDDANLEDMMQQMGTANGGGSFDPGEDDGSEDSDDEDIPDLENDIGEKVGDDAEKTD